MERSFDKYDPDKMALPESLEETETTNRKKRQHLFSGALFKEAYKSNKKSLWLVSGANGLLMILVISILSTLNINATSDAMKSLFSSANSESSIRSGAVSYYAGYEGVASAFEEANSTLNTLEGTLEQAIYLVSDSSTESSISTIQTVYNLTYALTSGDSETKHSLAKSTALTAASATIDASSTLSETEKETSKLLISYYLDAYHANSSATYQDLMLVAVPDTFADVVSEQSGLDSTQKAEVEEVFTLALTEVYTSGLEASYVSVKESFPLGKILTEVSDDPDSAYALLDDIEASFLLDTSSYISSTSTRYEAIASAVREAAFKQMEETAYYSYLPSFEVKYKTDELGWPIAYEVTGEYDENGDPIYKTIEVKTYQPDRFIEVAGDMGSSANLAQKRRKAALTGEEYTAEEIAEAKEEAAAELPALQNDISSFLSSYIVRDENGTNAYYDGTAVLKDEIASLATEKVAEEAGKSILETYNAEHLSTYSSVYDIPASEDTSSGKESMNTVYSYVSGAISSYRTTISRKLEEGYSSSDASLIATVVAITAVLDQLPTKVSNSLSEMGDMNTYAIVVGMIGFAIAALLIPLAYLVMLSNSLVSQKVESGSLAFTFSTPTKRSTFCFTEACYLLFTTLVMGGVLFACSAATREIAVLLGASDFETSLPLKYIALFSLGNFAVTLALSGISFLASCTFNKSGNTMGVAGGISIFFFICAILGIFGSQAIPGTVRIDAMNVFNYVTMFSLFDAHAVIVGDNSFYWKLAILVGIAAICYWLAGIVFEKKDLPL